MGRHRRSAAAPVAADYEHGSAGRHRGGAHRKKRILIPVRTGLLGVSAAMAVGAVAVASGLLPGGDTYTVGGGNDSGRQIRTEGSAELQTQGDASAEPTRSASASPSRSAERPPAPSKTPSPKPAKPSATPSKSKETTKSPEAEKKKQSTPPARTEARESQRPSERIPPAGPSPTEAGDAAEATVLSMVNTERAKVGCSPVRADAQLADLAGDFSEDMAARGFFDHTDPDGDTPWDRAEQAGIVGLGGENIARGQVDADAVMNAWMNSDGHRANILNCSYTTLGVGVHLGVGGPWWTQDFGF